MAESTRKLVGNLFELEDLGAQDLKGMSGPLLPSTNISMATAPSSLSTPAPWDARVSSPNASARPIAPAALTIGLRSKILRRRPLSASWRKIGETPGGRAADEGVISGRAVEVRAGQVSRSMPPPLSGCPASLKLCIAVAEAFGTYVAQVAEVTVARNGDIKVDRVVCAVDCGTPINPDVITAQMEGGIGFGLGAALYGAITLKDGKVEQTNFNSYQVLRIDEIPKVDVHIVQSLEVPTASASRRRPDRSGHRQRGPRRHRQAAALLLVLRGRYGLGIGLSRTRSPAAVAPFGRTIRRTICAAALALAVASCPLQRLIGHECRQRLANRGIVGALQLVFAGQEEIDHLLTDFDLDRPQPQPPAPPRFANAFPCRCNRHSPRL